MFFLDFLFFNFCLSYISFYIGRTPFNRRSEALFLLFLSILGAIYFFFQIIFKIPSYFFLILIIILPLSFFLGRERRKTVKTNLYQYTQDNLQINVYEQNLIRREQILRVRNLEFRDLKNNKKDIESIAILSASRSLKEADQSLHAFYHIAKLFINQKSKILVIGGGGFTLPKILLEKFPRLRIDVVEYLQIIIDIAKKYFFLPNVKNLNIIQDEGISFLKKHPRKKYDFIYIDVDTYDILPSSSEVNKENSIKIIHEHLTEKGAVIHHLMGTFCKENNKYFRLLKYISESYFFIFKKVYVLPIFAFSPFLDKETNILIITFKNPCKKNVQKIFQKAIQLRNSYVYDMIFNIYELKKNKKGNYFLESTREKFLKCLTID